MDSRPQSVLVIGATGTQGSAVVPPLVAAGFDVTALVREPASARAQRLKQRHGVELVRGDLFDRDSLRRAFAEVEAVYAVTTPFEDGSSAEVRQGEEIISAASEVKLPWLVLASVAAAARADVPHFRSKAKVEERLATSDLPWTVVAPSYFYENILGALPSIQDGRMPIPVPPDKPLHQVALRNLGEVVAAVLNRKEEHLGQRIEIAGDDPTPREMAAAFGVAYEELPLQTVMERNRDLGEMYTFLSEEGYGIDVPAVRERYPEVEWMSFAEWVPPVGDVV